jgi:hypothetical protein
LEKEDEEKDHEVDRAVIPGTKEINLCDNEVDS